jgi:Zn-dependent protease
MDSTHLILAVFEFVVLVFSLSLHEAAHAWTASKLGDPTARMMGRVTLNPIRHIDLVGTIIIPLFMLFMPGYGQFLIGWAKPTPVTPRNFKNITRDDILTTVAGPASNMLAAAVAIIALLIISKTSTPGGEIVHELAMSGGVDPSLMTSSLLPLALLFRIGLTLNLILFVFNLLPLPPLDGSHVIRHMLPYNALRVYDSLGLISLIFILFVGYRLIAFFVNPALLAVDHLLLSI